MRPPKVVLCVGSDEERLSVRAFLFRTNRYRVITSPTMEEALAILKSKTQKVDLMIVQVPLRDLTAAKLHEAARLYASSTLLISDRVEYSNPYGADVFLTNKSSPADILERAKVLCSRKRGPKRKPYDSADKLEVRRAA